jgi:tetratricopeptide (TPR) repeat protein
MEQEESPKIEVERPKNVDEYIAKYRNVLSSNPDCGTSRYNLAVGLIAKKMYDEAEKELLLAVEHSQGLAEAYVQLGGLCLRRGDLDGCLSYNKKAAKAKPSLSEAYANIGFIHIQRGEFEEAIINLKRATAFNFRSVQAYATLGSAYLMNGMVEESIENSLKALKLAPDFAVAHNNLAIAYLEKGEFDKAVEHCDRALALGYEVAPQILQDIEPHRQK